MEWNKKWNTFYWSYKQTNTAFKALNSKVWKLEIEYFQKCILRSRDFYLISSLDKLLCNATNNARNLENPTFVYQIERNTKEIVLYFHPCSQDFIGISTKFRPDFFVTCISWENEIWQSQQDLEPSPKNPFFTSFSLHFCGNHIEF